MRRIVLAAAIVAFIAVLGVVRVVNGQKNNSPAFEHHHQEYSLPVPSDGGSIPIQIPVALNPVRIDFAFVGAKGGVVAAYANSLNVVYSTSISGNGYVYGVVGTNLLTPVVPCAYVDYGVYSLIDAQGVLHLRVRNTCDPESQPQVRMTVWY